jgi:ATP-binding cassette subfamily B (MDR/TAP) protein 1
MDDSESGIIGNAFTQMRTVSAFSVQFKIAKIYNDITRAKTEIYKKKAWISGFAKGLAEFTNNAVFAVLFYYAGILLASGEFEFENVMVGIFSLMLASFGLGQALADLGDVREALHAAIRVFDTIDQGKGSTIDGLSVAGVRPEKHSSGRIDLCDVNFCYPTRPDSKVCQGYNLTIESGEMVALVGPSGSGKSTIMNLLLRFYDPLSGVVKLDGIDIKDLNVRWLRSQIGYVGQEPVLFKGSIAENIARGRPDFGDKPMMTIEELLKGQETIFINKRKSTIAYGTINSNGDIEMGSDPNIGKIDDDVTDAAKSSHAHEFIMGFSDQYTTDVGESSIMVSGGQKQRIAIARALIKKPAVLLLDEATSALDATSERYVQESIDALQQSKMQTTIVIAHRLTTIKNADKIAVINDGKVVEIGKHHELLELNGLYAELWNKQVGVTPASSTNNLQEAFDSHEKK